MRTAREEAGGRLLALCRSRSSPPGSATTERRRLFVPLGTDPARAARDCAREGWVTVAALEAGDTPEAQLCTHVLVDGEARPLGG